MTQADPDNVMADAPPPRKKGKAEAARAVKPRRLRYNGKTPREILFIDEHDEWVTAQMSARWSRNEVVNHCIAVTRNKVEVAAHQEEAIVATLGTFRKDLDGLAGQVRMLLAILTVDAQIRYQAEDAGTPQDLAAYRALVMERAKTMGNAGGKA